ncbi:hypothetical protein [Plasmodium yoelii yoelii]|uniref:Uncharacterized protein n=1 Tax=Plasmodium yoelii yoelii TaxID=73239 RepID=Q7RR26_PLAYO|nr:hypothetical protein [Plasmodium yoelii yoelii]
METLKGSMIQNLYTPQNNKIKNYNEKKTTSLFRNNAVSFYNDVNTEAIFLLDRATQPINYKIGIILNTWSICIVKQMSKKYYIY